ncbi:MAG: 50S ribosomal protein L23 [Nitrospinota bacterium]|nr:50S ribosomal protein L23 [Nitrospinota bacterium]MDP6619161.1 50S ribosomal protein L23 [Nitrospinota bacterium]
MKKDVREIIRRPLVTEKSTRANEETNKVTFVVRKDANKIEIKRAVEEVFGVNVLEVRTLNNRGKKKRVGARQGRKPDWKKAVVSLREGDRINLFEGV